MAKETVAVRPLQCNRCGALVPLGQGKAARCAYCGAETPIPAEYESMQRAAASFAADKRLAQELYGQVGKPPGWLARTWGRGAEQSVNIGELLGRAIVAITIGYPPLGLLLVGAAGYAAGYPVAAVIRGAAWVLGIPIRGSLSPFLVLLLGAICVLVFVGVPGVLYARERVSAGVRRDIHASLAAGLPERPGGPCRCRNCGAALDVPSGALGVPCSYCSADNLVALPADWVAQVRSSEFKHFMRIDAALEAYRKATVAAQDRIWMLIFGLIFVIPVLMAVAWFLGKANIRF